MTAVILLLMCCVMAAVMGQLRLYSQIAVISVLPSLPSHLTIQTSCKKCANLVWQQIAYHYFNTLFTAQILYVVWDQYLNIRRIYF